MHGERENNDGRTSDFTHPGAPPSDSPIFGQLMAQPRQTYVDDRRDPSAAITDWNLPKLSAPPVEPAPPIQTADLSSGSGGRHFREPERRHRHAAPETGELVVSSAAAPPAVPAPEQSESELSAIRLVFAEPAAEAVPEKGAEPQPKRESEAEASDEHAQAIVSDALAQAAMVLARAEENAEAILTQARQEAHRQAAHARAESDAMRDQAAGVLADARLRAEEIDTITADRARHGRAAFAEEQTAHERRLSTARNEHDEQLRISAAQAAAEADTVLTSARGEAERLRAETQRDVEATRVQLADQRMQMQKDNERLLEETRQRVDSELAEAREQTAWTKQTIDSLIAAAEADAEKIRRTAAQEAEAERVNARDDAQALGEAARARIEEQAAKSLREREKLYTQAAETLDSAHTDAAIIRQQAGEEAEQQLVQASEQSTLAEQAGRRRLQEAENGARAIRENASNDLARAQEEAREARRVAREEANTMITDARVEADELRSKARAILSDARAEVSVLTAHRDEISRQLGDLSGVIEALAVADRQDALAVLAERPAQSGRNEQQQEIDSKTEVSTQ